MHFDASAAHGTDGARPADGRQAAAPAGAGPAGAGPAGAGAPYLDALTAALGRVAMANTPALAEACRLVASVVAGGGVVHVFGSGHSQLAALEVSRRAGSIAPLQVILDPGWGAAELVEGYGEALLAEVTITPADCLIAISHSGTTAAPIEIARAARAHGAPVVAVTSLALSRAARPRHSSGVKLFELADVVLDTGCAERDAAVTVGADGMGVGPTSTLLAAALLHEVIVGAVFELVSWGLEPPVFRANSAEGGREHNERLRDRYRSRVTRVP